MKKILLFICFTFVCLAHASADNEELFNKASDAYTRNNFKEAQEHYENILNSGYESFELYYNLGNCYYKTNQLGKAVQFYHKALKIKPYDEDVQTNLKFAYLRTRDKIEPAEELFIYRWWKQLSHLFSSTAWSVISIITFSFLFLFFALFLVSKRTLARRAFFYSATLMFVLALFTYVLANERYESLTRNHAAVIAEESVPIKSSPLESSTNLFLLHEGTVVKIVEQNETWYRIKLESGKEGWVHENHIGLI